MKKYCIILVITLFSMSANLKAQAKSKPSDRSFATEVQQIRAKQAARNRMVRQSAQPGNTVNGASTVAPVIIPAVPATVNNPAPVMPVIKASQKPLKVPARPANL